MPENLEKRLKRQVHGKLHRFTAIVPLGFEATLVKELRQIGIIAENDAFETVDGKVSFSAKITDAWKAVAHSRIANRVLMDFASFKAENFRELEKKADEIPWELYLPPVPVTPDTVPVHVTCKHSRLYHSEMRWQNDFMMLSKGEASPWFALRRSLPPLRGHPATPRSISTSHFSMTAALSAWTWRAKNSTSGGTNVMSTTHP